MNAPVPDIDAIPASREITFDSAQGNRRGVPLAIDFIRALEPDDVRGLSGAVAAPARPLLQLRHIHHQLAMLICQGTDNCEVALITGYAPAYISKLQGDPAFQELIQYYATQREQVFVNVLERLKCLGLTSAEELARRLEEQPEKFTNREIMELTELALVKPTEAIAKGKAQGQGTPGVNISVSFVGTGPQPIDITPGRSE